jgi:hypothetical protein
MTRYDFPIQTVALQLRPLDRGSRQPDAAASRASVKGIGDNRIGLLVPRDATSASIQYGVGLNRTLTMSRHLLPSVVNA